jgi:hypothetical protein
MNGHALHKTKIGMLFRPLMVGAILANEKTETMRMKGLAKMNYAPEKWHLISFHNNAATFEHVDIRQPIVVKAPYGIPGDTLYVREAFRMEKEFDDESPLKVVNRMTFSNERTYGGKANRDHDLKFHFESDGPVPDWAGKKRPGIFLPLLKAKTRLRVRGLKLHRLTDITRESAIAEGIFFWNRHQSPPATVNLGDTEQIRSMFFTMWDASNDEFTSKFNPYVWSYKFEMSD